LRRHAPLFCLQRESNHTMSNRMGQAGRCGGRGGGCGSGRGRGYRGGLGLGQGSRAKHGATGPSHPSAENLEQKLPMLMTQAKWLAERLQTAKTRLTESLKRAPFDPNPSSSSQSPDKVGSPQFVAIVDEGACTSCGLCANLCPEKAITLRAVAAVNPRSCTGCGKCVAECPNQAISLVERKPSPLWRRLAF
jgi:ferredoxin